MDILKGVDKMKPLSRYLTEVKKQVKEIVVEETKDIDLSLQDKIIEKLDINNDGILSKADLIDLIVDFVDANGDGKASLWEYIALFLEIRKIIKKLK